MNSIHAKKIVVVYIKFFGPKTHSCVVVVVVFDYFISIVWLQSHNFSVKCYEIEFGSLSLSLSIGIQSLYLINIDACVCRYHHIETFYFLVFIICHNFFVLLFSILNIISALKHQRDNFNIEMNLKCESFAIAFHWCLCKIKARTNIKYHWRNVAVCVHLTCNYLWWKQ